VTTPLVCLPQVELQRRKGEPITEGWAQDPEGRNTTDADLAFKTGCLMPLGGPEITSGYKGYGLGLLVETFCGILAGKASDIMYHAALGTLSPSP
jgi:LDH2 family malate/lactate/ureidoglycolate dehydrogenase